MNDSMYQRFIDIIVDDVNSIRNETLSDGSNTYSNGMTDGIDLVRERIAGRVYELEALLASRD